MKYKKRLGTTSKIDCARLAVIKTHPKMYNVTQFMCIKHHKQK